jgi:hypothetical protein
MIREVVSKMQLWPFVLRYRNMNDHHYSVLLHLFVLLSIRANGFLRWRQAILSAALLALAGSSVVVRERG